MDSSRTYRIGEIAQQTGVSVETLRFYERRRLLNAPPRTQGGNAAIQRVLDTPQAFLSRLEGEGWLRFAC